MVADPQADIDEAERLYGIKLAEMNGIRNVDAVILAVAHQEFMNFKRSDFDVLYGTEKKVLLDIKGMLNRKEYEAAGYSYWRL